MGTLGMRLVAFVVVEMALVATFPALAVQEQESFALGDLMDKADGFAKQMAPLPSSKTPLERIEALKKSLTKKLLNTEIAKLPFTETELGEGMAVNVVKGAGASGA